MNARYRKRLQVSRSIFESSQAGGTKSNSKSPPQSHAGAFVSVDTFFPQQVQTKFMMESS